MKPYEYQQRLMVDPVTSVLQKEDTALLAAGTGLGKTIVALEVARNLGLVPFVVAPKVTLPSWQRTAEAMGVRIVDAVNIEKVRTGNTRYAKRTGQVFTWKLNPDSVLLILDEAHVCTGRGTLNANLAAAARKRGFTAERKVVDYRLRTLLMSATIGDSPIKFGDAIGYLLGLHNRSAYTWLLQHGCYRDNWGGLSFPKGPGRMRHLKKLHEELFPRFGVCVKHSDVPEFPDNQIFLETVDIKPKDLKELQAAYDKYELLMADEAAKGSEEANPMVLRLRARQMSEIAKVPHFVELTQNSIEEGNSVVIFTSYRETLDILLKKLKKFHPAVIRGTDSAGHTQTATERESNVQKFLRDQTRVCLAMISAGGVGVDLNDINGKYPRISIMSPCDSVRDYKQALGRIHRANSKSKAIQYLLIARNTVEEKITQSLGVKCQNIDAITDADFWSEGRK